MQFPKHRPAEHGGPTAPAGNGQADETAIALDVLIERLIGVGG